MQCLLSAKAMQFQELLPLMRQRLTARSNLIIAILGAGVTVLFIPFLFKWIFLKTSIILKSKLKGHHILLAGEDLGLFQMGRDAKDTE